MRLLLEINAQNLNEFYGTHAKLATVQQYERIVIPENFGRAGDWRSWVPGLQFQDSVAILKPIRAFEKHSVPGDFK